MSIGQELLDVPMGEMIRSMAFAIAEAQLKLDEASIETAEMMGGLKTIVGPNGATTFEDSRVFFGHEWISYRTALAQQSATPNAALANAISAVPPPDDHAATVAANAATAAAATAKTKANAAATAAAELAAAQSAVAAAGTSVTPTQTAAVTAAQGNVNSTADEASIAAAAAAKAAADAAKIPSSDTLEIAVPTRVSLLELGFAPVFYNFIDTIIEVKIAIKITQENSSEISTSEGSRDVQVSRAHRSAFFRGTRSRTRNVSTSQVNATYSSKYSYSAEGSSLLRTKLVPVPMPAILEERIRALMDADRQRKLTGTQPPAEPAAVN